MKGGKTMTPCINKENYELMKQIRDFSTSYCTFFETSGGRIGTYPESLIDKTIACFEKVLYNRLFIQEACHEQPRSFTDNLKMAQEILDGSYQDDDIHSLMKRVYG